MINSNIKEIIEFIQEDFNPDEAIIADYMVEPECFMEFTGYSIEDITKPGKVDVIIPIEEDGYWIYDDCIHSLNTPVVCLYVAYKEGNLKTAKDLERLEENWESIYNPKECLEKTFKFAITSIFLRKLGITSK